MNESSSASGFGFSARVMTLGFVLTALCAQRAGAQPAAAPLSADQAAAIGTDAYIYGYPLVTVEITRRVVTNAARPVGLRC
jgi:hypothetical protein